MDLRSLSNKDASRCAQVYFQSEGTKERVRNTAFNCIRKASQKARGAKFSTVTFSISSRRLSKKNFDDLIESIRKRISRNPNEHEDAATLERSKENAHLALGIAFRLSRTRLGKRIIDELRIERKKDYGSVAELGSGVSEEDRKHLKAWNEVLDEPPSAAPENVEEARVWQRKAAALNAWVQAHPNTCVSSQMLYHYSSSTLRA